MKTATIALEVWDRESYARQQDAFSRAIDCVLGRLITRPAVDEISAKVVSELNRDASILNHIVLFEYLADEDGESSRRVVHVEKIEEEYIGGRDLTRLDGERAGYRTFLENKIVGDILILV